jgi:hypothetical protein
MTPVKRSATMLPCHGGGSAEQRRTGKPVTPGLSVGRPGRLLACLGKECSSRQRGWRLCNRLDDGEGQGFNELAECRCVGLNTQGLTEVVACRFDGNRTDRVTPGVR